MKQVNSIVRSILIILTLIYCNVTNAQQIWDLFYNTQNFQDRPTSKLSIDSEGNYFIGITTTYVTDSDIVEGKSSIFKISLDGVLLDSVVFEEDSNQYFYPRNIIINDTLFLFGTRKYLLNDSLVFAVLKYDRDLNFVDSKSYFIPDSLEAINLSDIIQVQDKIIVSGSFDLAKFDFSRYNGITLLEFNNNLDSLNFVFYEDGFVVPFSIVESYDHDLIIPTTGWDFNNDIDTLNGATGFGFFSRDSLLPMFTRRIGSMMLHNGVSIKQYPDSTYIVSAEHHFFSQRNLGVFKISNEFIILDSIIISSSPIPYPNATFGQNLDFTNPNAIYFGSTENVQGSTASAFANHIRITKLDSNLNIIWDKFYGGDANYFCWTLKATEDGGCIALATRFDFLNDPDPNHLGTYILKLGPDGILTGIDDLEFEVKEVLVYPNPGRELKIATGFENYSLTLIDLNGKIVYKQKNLSRDSRHELSFLPGGMYIYRITSKSEEMLDSGKWVKQ